MAARCRSACACRRSPRRWTSAACAPRPPLGARAVSVGARPGHRGARRAAAAAGGGGAGGLRDARAASPRVSRPGSRPRRARSPSCRTAMPRLRRVRRCRAAARRAADVRVRGRRVTVAVRPRVPLVARLLRARVERRRRPGAGAMSPAGLRARAVDFFVEPREAPAAPRGSVPAPRLADVGPCRDPAAAPRGRARARGGRGCRSPRCWRTRCAPPRARRPRRSPCGRPAAALGRAAGAGRARGVAPRRPADRARAARRGARAAGLAARSTTIRSRRPSPRGERPARSTPRSSPCSPARAARWSKGCSASRTSSSSSPASPTGRSRGSRSRAAPAPRSPHRRVRARAGALARARGPRRRARPRPVRRPRGLAARARGAADAAIGAQAACAAAIGGACDAGAAAGRRRSCWSAGSPACSSGRSCSARCRARSAARAPRSAPRTCRRSRARGRCARHTRGCSSPPCSTAGRTRGTSTAPPTSRSGRARGAGDRGPERRGGATTSAFPDAATFAPVRIRVSVRERVEVERGHGAEDRAASSPSATAELSPLGPGGLPAGGGYDGPFALRQGKPMRPDVAQAFDRMERAARADGVALLITSAYRSDAEQAVLWRRHPDPRWVARPGESLHRYGTELDLGPPAAYAWLAANARRVPLRAALRERAVALRLRSQRPARRPGRPAASERADGRGRARAAELRARALRARARPRRAALERLGGAARGAAVRREQLQPVRHEPGGRAGDRAVHARARRARWASPTRSTPARRSTPRRG